jgi:hypothetical protein
MPKSAKQAKQAFWERGYLALRILAPERRLGQVRLGPKEWDRIYRWRAGNHSGEAATLEEAKRAVEQAALVGASQLALFDKP